MKTLGEVFRENIIKSRKSKGLSQIELAKKMNIMQATLSRIENGKTDPSISTIERIAKALETPVSDLFYIERKPQKSLLQKLEKLNQLSDYNLSVVDILLDSLTEKDRLEKIQNTKMKDRLAELEKVKEKHLKP